MTRFANRWKSAGRPYAGILAVLAVILLSGCSTGGVTVGRESTGEGQKIAFGSYLAAQHARSRRDTAAASRYFKEAIAADPDNVVLLQQGFSLAVTEGDYEAAYRMAQRLVANNAGNALPQLFLLLADVRRGRYEEVLARLDSIPSTGLNRLVKPLIGAWSHAGLGAYEAALAALQPLDETPAFRPFRRNHRALILDLSGDAEAAELAYKESLTADRQGSMRVVAAYAAFLARRGRHEEASRVLEEAAERFPDTVSLKAALRRLIEGRLDELLIKSPAQGVADAFYGGATALAQENARSPAIFYLRLALYLNPGFSEASLVLGRLFEMEEQYEAALAAYGAIADDDDIAREARLREVWVLEALGRQEEALNRLQDLLTRAPGTPDTVSALANLLRQRNQLEQAIAEYTKAINLVTEEAERHWVLYYARAIAYDQAQNWPRAEADLIHALELNPTQPEVLNYLGYSWVDRGINLKDAHAMLEEAVSRRPNDGYIVDSLGWSYYKLGNLEQAVHYLERAVLLRPEDSTINEHLGDAYWAVGRRTEARFQWSHALALGAEEDRREVLKAKIARGPGNNDGLGAAFKNGD